MPVEVQVVRPVGAPMSEVRIVEREFVAVGVPRTVLGDHVVKAVCGIVVVVGGPAITAVGRGIGTQALANRAANYQGCVSIVDGS